jgi:hypothetical protein
MTASLESKMGATSLNDGAKYERTPFGKEMRKHFSFDPTFRNLNHGTVPYLYNHTPISKLTSFLQARLVPPHE